MTVFIQLVVLTICFFFLKILSNKVARLEGEHYRGAIIYWLAAGAHFIGLLYGIFLSS